MPFSDIVEAVTGFADKALGGSDSTAGSVEQEKARVARTDLTGTATSKLNLDPIAIQKIIEDVLSAEGGLADIFGSEQTAGIFNSSVVKGQTADLVQGLVGELAKLTGETVESQDQSQIQSERQKQNEVSTSETDRGGFLNPGGTSVTNIKDNLTDVGLGAPGNAFDAIDAADQLAENQGSGGNNPNAGNEQDGLEKGGNAAARRIANAANTLFDFG
jgi:hypothetical protein